MRWFWRGVAVACLIGLFSLLIDRALYIDQNTKAELEARYRAVMVP